MHRIATFAALATLALGSAALAAPDTKREEVRDAALASEAKISLDDAAAIALKARPGKADDQELEKEAGGSGLRYTFEIVSQGKTYEVSVDAVTGAVLENGLETDDND